MEAALGGPGIAPPIDRRPDTGRPDTGRSHPDTDSAADLAVAVAAWLKHDDTRRPHQALGWQTPAERRADRLAAPSNSPRDRRLACSHCLNLERTNVLIFGGHYSRATACD